MKCGSIHRRHVDESKREDHHLDDLWKTFDVGKSGFASHTKHTAEATITGLFHS